MRYKSEKKCHDRTVLLQSANLFNNFNSRSVGDVFSMVGLKLLGNLGDSASVRDGTPRLQSAAPGSLKSTVGELTLISYFIF